MCLFVLLSLLLCFVQLLFCSFTFFLKLCVSIFVFMFFIIPPFHSLTCFVLFCCVLLPTLEQHYRDRTARLWSTDKIYPLRIFAGHLSDIDTLKFHPNCNYLATGST